jgi:sugar phosphate permease
MRYPTRLLPPRLHYGWVVVAVVFLTLLAAAGVRAAPSVLIVPLEEAFGWSRATISFAISLNIVLYGLMGPFAGALMLRIGVRRTILAALALLAVAVGASSFMTEPWQLVLTWGVLVGLGSGVAALVFGATIVSRWFVARRGLVMGILTASTATGQLVFLPALAAVATGEGWRPVVWIVALAAAAMIPVAALLLPETPQEVGLRPYGETGEAAGGATVPQNPIVVAFAALGRGVKSGDFWLLFASFFVCGASTNGLVGTHLISYCLDHGIPEVRAAGLLAAMGVFDLVGTTLSGWLTDRYSSRVLLCMYYGFRGLSLLYLPYSNFDAASLSVFAVFYGLDWIATVPPTVRLISDIFGKRDAPIVFGWVLVGHQFGAGFIAFVAGAMRADLGSYVGPFLIAGGLCVVTAFYVLRIGRGRGAGLQPAEA